MSWQLWRQTLRVAGHVPKMSVICVQFVPNLSPGDKFGINLGQIGDTRQDTRRDTRRDTTMSRWCHPQVWQLLSFVVPRGRQRDAPKQTFEHFWATCGNAKALLPPAREHHFWGLGGQPLAGYYYVMSLDQVSLKWVSSESSEYPFWPSEPQVSLKWVPKFLASEYQVSAQVRAKWGRGDKLKLNWVHGLRPSESASIVGQVRLKLFIYNETMTSTIEHFAWHWPAIDTVHLLGAWQIINSFVIDSS